MLRPQDTATRERKSLNGLWSFRLDAEGAGRDARWFAGPLADAVEVPVPASYNDIFADAAVRDHVGDAWYQTRVRVPRGWAGERIVLRFDAATHAASVWLGETHVVSHEGGYTPFEADVTELVTPGEEYLVTAAVNNELSFETIPPGYVEDQGHRRHQKYFHDFFNYAGLHRTVWLYSTPRSFVSDITVVTDVEGATGVVHFEVEASGEGGVDVEVTLRDAEGVEVATGTRADGELRVADAHLWGPGDGYLYELEARLVRDGATVDAYVQTVGIRTVEVRGTQFLINGEPFYFTGFGKHEDSPVRGKGH
ncbi:MAG: beta-glucuronidase, partial [Actinomycetota bacterium]|nr:beta-glucuronidase [Actinomycetota bacterium]